MAEKDDGRALGALREWSARRRPRPGEGPAPCDRAIADACEPLGRAAGPEEIVHFRQPVTIEPLTVDLGDPVEHDELLEYSCVPVTELSAEIALDLRYRQNWFFKRTEIGALSASVALAPGETLSVSMRNTQRKQFDRETVEEVERTEQTESTIADKDVLNVTRSASKTNNWTINGNASISLSGFGAGVGGSLSESVTAASNSSAQRTSESTRKSASNLKTLQKVQIRETTEVTAEATTARTIMNPYRDRSVRLDVYELAKLYCVEFHLAEFVPVVVLDLRRLRFDRAFVLTNGAFLTEEIIDRLLEFELAEALQTTTDLHREDAVERAEQVALTALGLLFAGPPVFNFPQFPQLGTPARPPGWNENNPASSFQEPLRSFSGLADATANTLGVVFSTLAFYHRLYTDHVLPSNGRLAVEAAMSLDQALAPRWTGAEETEAIANVIDAEHATEVLRRLGGFLTMTSGILRPLLEPAEAEREERRAAERAEFVIRRVVEHLNCHSRYYTERYLAYMAEQTRMRAVHRLVEETLAHRIADAGVDLLTIFDAEASFLDGRRVVVPIRVPVSPEELAALLERLHQPPLKVKPGLLDAQELSIPMDGVHIEPTAGACVLPGVPEPPAPLPVKVVIDR